MSTDSEKLAETRPVAVLIASVLRPEECPALRLALERELSERDRFVALHRELSALLKSGVIPAHLRPGVEAALADACVTTEAEQLAEARHLCALLFAQGHAFEHERLREILDNPMDDSARLQMLRYEAGAQIDNLPPGHELIPRLRALANG